jgi:hypothetical protein
MLKLRIEEGMFALFACYCLVRITPFNCKN